MQFFFDITVNGHQSSDTIGADLNSLAHMRKEAIRSLIEIANEEATESEQQEFAVTVRDNNGAVYGAAISLRCGVIDSGN